MTDNHDQGSSPRSYRYKFGVSMSGTLRQNVLDPSTPTGPLLPSRTTTHSRVPDSVISADKEQYSSKHSVYGHGHGYSPRKDDRDHVAEVNSRAKNFRVDWRLQSDGRRLGPVAKATTSVSDAVTTMPQQYTGLRWFELPNEIIASSEIRLDRQRETTPVALPHLGRSSSRRQTNSGNSSSLNARREASARSRNRRNNEKNIDSSNQSENIFSVPPPSFMSSYRGTAPKNLLQEEVFYRKSKSEKEADEPAPPGSHANALAAHLRRQEGLRGTKHRHLETEKLSAPLGDTSIAARIGSRRRLWEEFSSVDKTISEPYRKTRQARKESFEKESLEMMQKLQEVADNPRYWDVRSPYPQHSAFPENEYERSRTPTPEVTPKQSDDEVSESSEDENFSRAKVAKYEADMSPAEYIELLASRDRNKMTFAKLNLQKRKNSSDPVPLSNDEKLQIERSIPKLPRGGAMGELRHILKQVEKGTIRKIEKNWPIMKYAFRVHDMKMSMTEVMDMFQSFTGFDQYRVGDIARLERSLKIHLVKESERDHHFIDYKTFLKCVGPRNEEAGETEGKEPMNSITSDVLKRAYGDGDIDNKTRVLEKLGKKFELQTTHLPSSYKIIVANEIFDSGMADAHHWANIALKTTMRKLESKAASGVQRGLRGWIVRHRIKEEKNRQRMQYYLNIFLERHRASAFRSWYDTAMLQLDIRRRCWQPFKLWHKWAVYQIYRKELMRLCFWPMYIWRRWTIRRIDARNKSLFLLKVWKVLLSIRIIRAWRSFVKLRGIQEKKIRTQHARTSKRLKRASLDAFFRNKERCTRIKICIAKVQMRFKVFMKYCFAGWRYYTLSNLVLPSLALKYRWKLSQTADAKKTRIAANSVIPTFPSPSELGVTFGSYYGQDKQKDARAVEWVCARMREQFHVKLCRETKVIWCETRWIIPRVIKLWLSSIKILVRDRRVRYSGFRKFMRRMFFRFKLAVGNQKQEKLNLLTFQQRREERESRSKEVEAAFYIQWEKDIIWREEGIENCERLQQELLRVVRTRRKNVHSLNRHARKLLREREIVKAAALLVKGKKTAAIQLEVNQNLSRGESLQQNRMEILKETLGRVLKELNSSNSKRWVKKTFSRLKLVVLQKKSLSKFRRARLANWLRVCLRLEYVNRGIPIYHKIRIKWVVLNKWLMFLDRKYQHETPGLSDEIQRRTHLSLWWSRHISLMLGAQVFMGGNSALYIEDDSRHKMMHCPLGILSRWSHYTQHRICMRRIMTLRKILIGLRLKQRVIDGWFSSVKATHTYASRRANREGKDLCFWENRVLADLDKWKCRYIMRRKRAMANVYIQRRRNLCTAILDQTSLKQIPTLKKLLLRFTREVKLRVRREQRLLCVAFQQRQKAKWNDHCRYGIFQTETERVIPEYNRPTADLKIDESKKGTKMNSKRIKNTEKGSPLVSKAKSYSPSQKKSRKNGRRSIKNVETEVEIREKEGFVFVEPGPANVPDNPMKFSEVVVYYSTVGTCGVVGITRILRGGLPDGTIRVTRGIQHGLGESDLGPGGGIERESFTLEIGEKLICIRGYTSADRDRGVGRLQFVTSTGRVSPWYGNDKDASQMPFEIVARPEKLKSKRSTRYEKQRSKDMETSKEVKIAGSSKSLSPRHIKKGKAKKKSPKAKRRTSVKKTKKNKKEEVPIFTENVEEGNDGTTGYIVGFCGRSSSKRILSIGAILRQKQQPNVLSGCWKDIRIDDVHQMRKAESEFAVLLRIRACEVFGLLHRAEQLAKRMRSTRHGIERADGVLVSAATARWFFESFSRCLVRVPARELEVKANDLRMQGQMQLKRGEELLQKANDLFEKVEGYDPATGSANLSAAQFGIAFVRQAKRTMEEADNNKRRGLVMIAQGQNLVREADSMIPGMKVTLEMRDYYEGLYSLARTANSLTPVEEEMLAHYDEL